MDGKIENKQNSDRESVLYPPRDFFISIIIPIYNCESYLEKCLGKIDTLLKPHSMELLLIDDGSTDASPYICDEYCKHHENVKVFHTENQGVSAARNYGLRLSHGDYICFVDADDYIIPEQFEKALLDIEETKCDMYFYPFTKELGNHQETLYQYSLKGKHDIGEARKKVFKDGGCAPWSKFFSRRVIETNHISFNGQLKIHEDVMFCLDMMEASENIFYGDYSFYFYRFNPSGAVQKHKIEYISNYDFCYKRWKEFLQKYSCEYEIDTLNSQYLHKMLTTCGKLRKHGCKKEKIKKALDLVNLTDELVHLRFKSVSDRIKQMLFRYRLFWLTSLLVK